MGGFIVAGVWSLANVGLVQKKKPRTAAKLLVILLPSVL